MELDFTSGFVEIVSFGDIQWQKNLIDCIMVWIFSSHFYNSSHCLGFQLLELNKEEKREF